MKIVEYLPHILAILTIIISIIAIFQSRKNYNLQNRIAHLQGVYKSPQLDLKIYNKSIVNEYYFAFPFSKHGAFIVPLKFYLTNTGTSKATNIEIYINASNELLPPDLMEIETNANTFSEAKTKKIRLSEHKTTYAIKMDYLENGGTGFIPLYLPLKSSTVNIKNLYTHNFRDNEQITFEYGFSYSYNLKIWAYSENHSPISEEISIIVVDTSEKTLKDFFIEKAKEKKEKHNANLSELTKIQKLKYYMSKNHKLNPKISNICYITSNDFQEDKLLKKVFYPNKLEIGYGVIASDGFTLIGPLSLYGY